MLEAGNDSVMELAQRTTPALYHRASMVDSDSGGSGEASSVLFSLATLTKDAVTSSSHLLVHFMPKNAPNVHLFPSDLMSPEHVTMLNQVRARPPPLCSSIKAYFKYLA